MRKPIGKIVLSKNRLGWTDNVNGIILTMRNKEAIIYEDHNLYLINQACTEGKITFIKFDDK